MFYGDCAFSICGIMITRNSRQEQLSRSFVDSIVFFLESGLFTAVSTLRLPGVAVFLVADLLVIDSEHYPLSVRCRYSAAS
jgi:dolichol kinase